MRKSWITPLQKQRLEVFYKKAVLKNFAIFTKKHLCWSFLNKVADLEVYSFIKKRLQHRCFLVNIVKTLRAPIWRTSANRCFWTKCEILFFLYNFSSLVIWPMVSDYYFLINGTLISCKIPTGNCSYSTMTAVHQVFSLLLFSYCD